MKNTHENTSVEANWKHTAVQLEQSEQRESMTLDFFTKGGRKVSVRVCMIGDYIATEITAHHGTDAEGYSKFMSQSKLTVYDGGEVEQRCDRNEYNNIDSIGEVRVIIDQDGKARKKGKL